MLLRVRAFYHVKKARVMSENDKALADYRTNLKNARRNIHVESRLYQEQIEDRYLFEHQQDIRKKHFDNQCSFRKQLLTQSYRLFENHARWKLTDDHFASKLNTHLHDEDVRKINRSRILKIMEHESLHYWFNADNVDTRLKEDTLFPEYIASSEYYYKLFAEALAYELGNFHELHQVTSNEEIIREKNKYLIPLYLELRKKMTAYKLDEIKQLREKNDFELQRIRNSKKYTPEELEELEQKLRKAIDAKIKIIEERNSSKEAKIQLLKTKIRDLVSIFKTWKEYTNILAMTSAQVIKSQYDIKDEAHIHKAEKEVLRNLKSKRAETFIDSIEEDTEELEISFEDYLAKINQDRKQGSLAASDSISIDDLDLLLKTSEAEGNEPKEGDLSLTSNQLDLSQLITPQDEAVENSFQGSPTSTGELVIEKINSEFLNARQTTSSVQILKQQFKHDQQFQVLLNQLGEIDVRYPKLFETIWASIQN